MGILKTWEYNKYFVNKMKLDSDLCEFDVFDNEYNLIGTIVPANIEDMDYIEGSLDEGVDVNGWEDGMGGIIQIQ